MFRKEVHTYAIQYYNSLGLGGTMHQITVDYECIPMWQLDVKKSWQQLANTFVLPEICIMAVGRLT